MTDGRSTSASPYGPATPAIRRFFMHFAGLGASDRAAVVAAYARIVELPAYAAIDASLGDLVARSGRDEARAALSGPLFQLVRRRDATAESANAEPPATASADDPCTELEPVAEPTLAALLALLVRDLLPAEAFDLLYGPFDRVIPRLELSAKS